MRLQPLRSFFATEASGGAVLLAATAVAVVWANSPFSESYSSLWHSHVGLELGSLRLPEDLQHWINDALMAIFFFVVGLEIKQEITTGELNSRRKASLPILAAIGGMVVPAVIYLGFNSRGAGSAGWGIPMATDIAFAVGVLAVLGSRVPRGLRAFLLSLAIVDDIGAIVVIAVFYSADIQLGWVGAAALLVIATLVAQRLPRFWVPIYVVFGAGVWLATFQSGIHATIAGVALGLSAPTRSMRKTDMSVSDRLENFLHPWTSYVVIPLFALANAGVVLSVDAIGDAVGSRVTLGVIAGLVVGKIAGISALSWVALKLRLGEAPAGVTGRHLIGGAAVAGIGFTVSLFITALAFTDAQVVAEAKIGVFAGSLVAGAIGAAILATGSARSSSEAGSASPRAP